MAGFFGLFDYSAPGKGVDKNAPAKRPFFLFFELLWPKLGRLVFLNLIYFVILLPILTAVYYLFYNFTFSWLTGYDAGTLAQMGLDPSNVQLPLLPAILLGIARGLPAWLSAVLRAISVILYGPASCGMAFMLRSFVLQEHVWNSDFFDKLRQNFKQGLALGLIDIVLLCLFLFNIIFISNSEIPAILVVAQYVSMALLAIYLFMRNYFFILTVTFHLTIFQLLKASSILSVAGLWRNFLVLIVNAALIILTVFLWPLAELVMMPLLVFSLMGFVSMFTCFPVVKKYMIDPRQMKPEK